MIFSFNRWKKFGREYNAIILAMSDQLIISGLNFFTSILIGRYANPSELGIYAICFTIILLTSAASESIVISPYTLLFRKVPTERLSKFSGSIFALQVLIAFAVSISMFFLYIIFHIVIGYQGVLLNILPILALILPFSLARELVRRYSMAHLHPINALIVDLITAGVQLTLLVIFAFGYKLNAWLALFVIGTANLSGLIPWWLIERPSLQIEKSEIFADMKLNAALGIWNFAALTTFVAQLSAAPWILAFVGNTSSVGIFAACNSIVMIGNPLMQGVANHLMPRSSLAWSDFGFMGLKELIDRYTLILAIVMISIGAPLAAFGGSLLTFFFGNDFVGNGLVISILVIAMIVRASAMSSYIGLWSIGRSDINAGVNILSLAAMIAAMFGLYEAMGLVGAAIAILLADLVSGLARWFLFRNIKPF